MKKSSKIIIIIIFIVFFLSISQYTYIITKNAENQDVNNQQIQETDEIEKTPASSTFDFPEETVDDTMERLEVLDPTATPAPYITPTIGTATNIL